MEPVVEPAAATSLTMAAGRRRWGEYATTTTEKAWIDFTFSFESFPCRLPSFHSSSFRDRTRPAPPERLLVRKKVSNVADGSIRETRAGSGVWTGCGRSASAREWFSSSMSIHSCRYCTAKRLDFVTDSSPRQTVELSRHAMSRGFRRQSSPNVSVNFKTSWSYKLLIDWLIE